MKKTLKSLGGTLLVLAFWLALWWLGAIRMGRELLLPSPLTVLERLLELALTADFWLIVLRSILRVVCGILLALISGVLLALLTSNIPFLRRLFYPLLSVIKATPVASFVILALLWLGSSALPVFISMLIVLPVVWAAVSDGIDAFDKDLTEVCRVFSFPFGKRLRLLYLPTVTPYFLSACKTSIGMAWKAGVAAEILAVSPVSIGKQLYEAKIYLETPDLFAWTLVVVLLSLIIEKLVTLSFRALGKREIRRATYAQGE
ncbi:MAG: ABC transporter permease subunit [Clostridia bacterium]|nr:ABC transporter permease subunit [Clostridia bacterium]